jgi:hypothetical protein
MYACIICVYVRALYMRPQVNNDEVRMCVCMLGLFVYQYSIHASISADITHAWMIGKNISNTVCMYACVYVAKVGMYNMRICMCIAYEAPDK